MYASCLQLGTRGAGVDCWPWIANGRVANGTEPHARDTSARRQGHVGCCPGPCARHVVCVGAPWGGGRNPSSRALNCHYLAPCPAAAPCQHRVVLRTYMRGYSWEEGWEAVRHRGKASSLRRVEGGPACHRRQRGHYCDNLAVSLSGRWGANPHTPGPHMLSAGQAAQPHLTKRKNKAEVWVALRCTPGVHGTTVKAAPSAGCHEDSLGPCPHCCIVDDEQPWLGGCPPPPPRFFLRRWPTQRLVRGWGSPCSRRTTTAQMGSDECPRRQRGA